MNQSYILPYSRVDHLIAADSHPQSLISWEREDRARTLRESGWAGPHRKYEHNCVGTGPNCQLEQAIFGPDKETWDQTVASEHPASTDYGPYVFNERFSHKNRPGGLRLTAAQAKDLYGAVAYANTLGLVMNCHVSITWGLLGILDHTEAANALTHRVIKALRQWYKDHTGRDQLAWLYVHENGRIHGFHTHLMLAIPNDLRMAFREWLKSRLSNVSRLDSMPEEAWHVTAPPSDPIGRQSIYIQYLTKGIDEKAELPSRVGRNSHIPISRLIKFEVENPGDVRCRKKCGVSNLIGVKARQRAGFRSLLDQGVTDVRRLYAGLEYLDHLRRSILPMGDPVVRRLLEVEERVQSIIQSEEENRKDYEKQRRQSRKKRRIALRDEAIMQAELDAFRKEQKDIRERVLRLIKL
jgi:hypothetical protein